MSEENQASGGGGGLAKLVPLLLILNTVAVLAMVGVLFLSFQKEKSQPKVEDMAAASHGGEHGEAAEGGHGDAGGHGAPAEEHGGGGGEHGGGGDAHGGGGHGAPAAKKELDLPDTGKIISLDPFTVNLSNGAGLNPRYVRMNISIELEKGASDQEFTIKTPKVRDTVINILNSKKTSDINASEGREQLKEEMKKAINSFMTQSKVKGVYFTNFAISQ